MELTTIIPTKDEKIDLDLSTLLNVNDIQLMMDNFYKIAGIPMAIIDLKGKVLVGVGWQDICTKFHRVNPATCRNCIESDIKLTASIPKGEFKLYRCKNGMWDMATPIFIGSQRIGNLFIGQFFFKGEEINYEHFRKQAKRYNFNEPEYFHALGKVPFLERKDVECAKHFFIKLADSLSQLSYSNIKLVEAVTETKTIAESLRRSEELFSSTLASISDAVIATDRDGTVTFINHAAQEIIGLDSPRVISNPVDEILILLDNKTRKRIKNPVISVQDEIRDIKPVKNILLRRNNGKEIPIEASSSPIRDRNGVTVGVVLVFRDISERIMAEKMLDESKLRLERSQQIAHLGSWELDIRKNELTWSDEVYHIFGLKPGEFKATYEAFLTAVHPDDRAEVNKAYLNSLKNKNKGYEIEHRILRKNGEIRYVHEKCEHVRDRTGKIIRSLGMVHDITERKKSEKELIESRKKLDIAIDIGNIGVWEWDLFTDEVTLDRRMERILGLEPDSFSGTFNDFENLLNEEDLSHFKKTISEAINENKPFETIFRVREDEGNKYINVKAIAEYDRTGRLVKMTGVSFDITQMKKGAEEVLFNLNEELLRSNKALEHFAYVASHDLQEPLRMVSSFTQLLALKYGSRLDDDAREYIRYANEGSQRMYDMINGLLAYSRIQTGVKEFHEVDLNKVLDQVKKNLSLQIFKSGAAVTTSKLPIVFADENQMVQLLQNLLSNAIKFCCTKPVVRVSLSKDPEHYIFSVKDNGIGIDPQYFERIFKIFQRLVPREEYPGTGIGLAICKIIVERHGGNIRVESVPGKGSTFIFTLPKNPVNKLRRDTAGILQVL